MNKAYWEPIIIDYLDGQLPADKKQALESALENSEELQQMMEEFQIILQTMEEAKVEETPSTALDHKFYAFLEKEQQQLEDKTAKRVSIRKNYKVLFQIAAAVALLVLGAAIATFVTQQDTIDQLAVEMKERENKMLALLEAQSVSNRIKAVNISYKMQAPNDVITEALIKVMNTDKSTNVRLAAIEALHKFADNSRVKNALVEALLQQTDPSLQIVLINILVEIQEQRAVKHLENIINDAEANESVKDEAHLGIFKLS